MEKIAVRNIRLCTKDCLCLYVCPTGASDTENSIIDVNKCTGCGLCADACPSGAISLVPKEYPETTEGYEGYYHLDSIQGNVTDTKIKFLIRDFQKVGFEQRKKEFLKIVNDLNKKYNNCITIEISDTYYNMKEIIAKHMHLIENAKKAMRSVDVNPITREIRGGTDGSELSEKGLPCPNLGTGGHNFHGIHEYICLEDMEKVTEILVEIVKLYSK